MHIPFGCIVKFQSIIQSHGDYLSHPVVFSLILLSRKFATFLHFYYYDYSFSSFFTPAFADGFSLELEWQQFSSILQDLSRFSGRSQQYCSLGGINSFPSTGVFSDSKSPKVPRTLLSILADLNNVVVWNGSLLLLLFSCPPVLQSLNLVFCYCT